jgi:endonuclease/exonuclease/phosphatase (EEP) superfamily protein YafD
VLRVLGILVAALFAVATAVLTWPSFFRVDQTFPIAQIISFRSLMAVGFAVAAVLMLLLAIARPVRGFALSMALVAIVGTLGNGAVVMTRGTGTTELPDETATSVRVMTWNTAGEATDPVSVAQTAVAMQADIVSLPETTIESGEQIAIAMRELGRPMWAHHVEFSTGVDTWDARSTTLLISPELGDYSVIESSQDGSSNTAVLPSAVAMPVDGQGPIVVAVHAVAPREDDMDHWRDDLRWLADQCASGNVIMAGDFNATIDHMARLGVDGGTLGYCHDGASESGNGAVGTWTTDLPALAGTPIDHVLATSNWKVTGSIVLRSLDGSGSDHRPLVVQLEPAG